LNDLNIANFAFRMDVSLMDARRLKAFAIALVLSTGAFLPSSCIGFSSPLIAALLGIQSNPAVRMKKHRFKDAILKSKDKETYLSLL